MHSYIKQIERLLEFVNDSEIYFDCYCCDKIDPTCMWHKAHALLNDEPVRYTGAIPLPESTYGQSESPENYKEEGWNPSMRLYV